MAIVVDDGVDVDVGDVADSSQSDGNSLPSRLSPALV